MRVPDAEPPVPHRPEEEPEAPRAVPLLPDDGLHDVVGEERGDAVEGRLDGGAGGVEDREDLAGDEEVVGGAVVEP